MSERVTRRLIRSMPRAVRLLMVTLSLLALVSLKWPSVFRLAGRWGGLRPPMPSSLVLGFRGHSTLTTSAPSAPSHRLHQGPARTQMKSSTRIPVRAPGAVVGLASVCTTTSPPGRIWPQCDFTRNFPDRTQCLCKHYILGWHKLYPPSLIVSKALLLRPPNEPQVTSNNYVVDFDHPVIGPSKVGADAYWLQESMRPSGKSRPGGGRPRGVRTTGRLTNDCIKT